MATADDSNCFDAEDELWYGCNAVAWMSLSLRWEKSVDENEMNAAKTKNLLQDE